MKNFYEKASRKNIEREGERTTGIEPAFSVWKTDALPLSYVRVTCKEYKILLFFATPTIAMRSFLVESVGCKNLASGEKGGVPAGIR